MTSFIKDYEQTYNYQQKYQGELTKKEVKEFLKWILVGGFKVKTKWHLWKIYKWLINQIRFRTTHDENPI